MNFLKKLYAKMSEQDLNDLLVISNDLQIQQLVFSELLSRELRGEIRQG